MDNPWIEGKVIDEDILARLPEKARGQLVLFGRAIDIEGFASIGAFKRMVSFVEHVYHRHWDHLVAAGFQVVGGGQLSLEEREGKLVMLFTLVAHWVGEETVIQKPNICSMELPKEIISACTDPRIQNYLRKDFEKGGSEKALEMSWLEMIQSR